MSNRVAPFLNRDFALLPDDRDGRVPCGMRSADRKFQPRAPGSLQGRSLQIQKWLAKLIAQELHLPQKKAPYSRAKRFGKRLFGAEADRHAGRRESSLGKLIIFPVSQNPPAETRVLHRAFYPGDLEEINAHGKH